jgi:hypothetical protein
MNYGQGSRCGRFASRPDSAELVDLIAAEAHAEVKSGWANSYSPEAIEKAVNSLDHKSLGYRTDMFIARMCFRGIYFPQMGRLAWLKVIGKNRRTIVKLGKEAFGAWYRSRLRAGENLDHRPEIIHPN